MAVDFPVDRSLVPVEQAPDLPSSADPPVNLSEDSDISFALALHPSLGLNNKSKAAPTLNRTPDQAPRVELQS